MDDVPLQLTQSSSSNSSSWYLRAFLFGFAKEDPFGGALATAE
jgi:hypothetical protein